MKKNLISFVGFMVLAFAAIFIISNCKPVTGDNKLSKIDSAPKPELAALSIRNDVPPVFTNKFNGEIKFVEKNLFDTITYDIFVNYNKVRIDKIQGQENKESYLFNLQTKEMIALHHQRQLYSIMPIPEEKTIFDSTFKVIKSENEKNILGMKCKQWRVKNTKENTEITYWVSTNNFGFYYYLTKVWNSNSKVNKYFQIIPNSFGYMPIETSERSLLRDLKSTILITYLNNANIDSTNFIVPKSYALFSN